jgi:hypothetical protein
VDSANWIALAAVASVTLVGVVGPIITGVQQRRAEHEKHVRDRRADVYIDMLAWLEQARVSMERTYPSIGSLPEPPAPPTEQEQWMLNARVAAYGSERVKRLLEEWNQKILHEFTLGALYLKDMEEAQKAGGRITREEWGITLRGQYRKLQGIRDQARVRLEELQRVVARELQISPRSAARQDPSDRFNAWLERNGRELPQRDVAG